MYFYINGSTVGVSITSIWALLFLLYVMFELISYGITRIFLLHRLFLTYRVKKLVRRSIPDYWSVKISNLSILKSDTKHKYYFQVDMVNKITNQTINEFISVSFLGSILTMSIINFRIGVMDSNYESEIKQWNRDKVLNKLGV